jgi:hypothetical protein
MLSSCYGVLSTAINSGIAIGHLIAGYENKGVTP